MRILTAAVIPIRARHRSTIRHAVFLASAGTHGWFDVSVSDVSAARAAATVTTSCSASVWYIVVNPWKPSARPGPMASPRLIFEKERTCVAIALRFYGSSLTAMNFPYYVWGGVRARGGSLLSLSGRPGASVRDLLRDIAIAAPFWVVWEAAA